ncbi:MAG: DNA topoisomerase [Methanolobus sp.]
MRGETDKELQAKGFLKIEALFNSNGADFTGIHRAGNIHEKEKADEIFARIKDSKIGLVDKKRVKEARTNPPYPLNTTEFLKRSSKFLGVSPEEALETAEQLYLSGFTSYPRTETNKYADDFDFKSKLVAFSSGTYQKYALTIISSGEISCRNGTKDGHDHLLFTNKGSFKG